MTGQQAEALTSGVLTLAHGFFTRRGGVSKGAFASLNCSLSSADDPAAVAENRARAAARLGAPVARLIGLTQIHSADVVVAETAWQPGEGPRADALVTAQPGLALAIITADCAPVLLADTTAGVAGAAHAGWRGAAGGVLDATVAAMIKLGAHPARIAAAIGPCIAPASYEVGADMRDAVTAADPTATRFFAPGRDATRFQFDLPAYCAARLASAGVGHIATLGLDTRDDAERFFSHRRRTLAGGGPLGHQLSAIML